MKKKNALKNLDYEKKPKVPVGFSFSGERGYEALRIIEEERGNYSKSGLIVDLVLMFQKAKRILGTENTIAKIEILLDEIEEKKKS